MFCLIFLLGHMVFVTTYGKTRYFNLNIFLSVLNFDHMSLACFLLLVVSFSYTRLLII